MDFKSKSQQLSYYLNNVLSLDASKEQMIEVYLKEAYNYGLLDALQIRKPADNTLTTNIQA